MRGQRFTKSLPRLKALRAEVEARGIRTGLEDDHDANSEGIGMESPLTPGSEI